MSEPLDQGVRRPEERPATPLDPPREAPRPRRRSRQRSVVIVNTGDGKGKTTSAMGTMLRARARGWRVAVVQFMKSGDWRVGEEWAGGELGVDWWTIGDGFTWESDDLDRSAAVARAGWEAAAARIADGEHHLVVLDEITYPMNYGWISTDAVVQAIAERPEHVNVVATGRVAPLALVEVADTVTEMRKFKHAYDSGIGARRGIEY